MKSTHPRPLLDRVTQYGAAALAAVMLVTVPLQIALALTMRPAGVFVLTAVFTLLLTPFVLLLTTATPALTIERDGLRLQPLIWKPCFVPWQSVTAVKPYPLLPHPQGELTRKAVSGRKRYRSAEGIMLVIPGLPLQYCIAGVLSGEGFTPAIAITNRTHTNYDRLIQEIFERASPP